MATSAFVQSWRDYRPSKSAWFWSCVAAAVATMIVGFSWGGWVTGGTASQMASRAADDARSQLVAAYCVDRVSTASDAAADLDKLKKADSWARGDLVRKAGWVTVPGTREPVSGAAELCADRLAGLKLTQAAATATAVTK